MILSVLENVLSIFPHVDKQATRDVKKQIDQRE